MEQPQINPFEPAGNPLPLKETNLMQINLIKKSGEDPWDWILKNAGDFREIIDTNPHLIQQYQKNPEVVENFINEQLQRNRGFFH